ncbi:hypothetical protein A9Q84_20630 [Halobacteriovorax marinus]|uniref:Kazal-like domain-containing protein n=1 Tax=Halobacteriovorax marinus TaxID=97084 RepID=A0A1Y5F196_9BACT|nr:hypothetical protein A9Q84_20630 [Halobacteriovorax marinus]
MKVLIFAISTFLLISCGADQLNKKETTSGASSSSPISQSCNCTFEYNPVCSGGQTYDNSCIAGCNGVEVYSNGRCECNTQSGEVCAQPPMPVCPQGMACAQVMPMPLIYPSECDMKRAGAQFIKNGSCN